MADTTQTKSDNIEREQRILDAAVGLFVHYGFDKTTVSDIAKQAGISKGAIYLHFDSKDALFEALLVREIQRYSEHWISLLEDDENGGTIGGMYKNSLYALDASPFMAAIFKQDSRVLGSYIRKPDNFFRKQAEAGNHRYHFVQMMQDAGAMRADVDASVIAHIMDMLAYGLVSMGEIKNENMIPPAQDVIEGIALIMDSALTVEGSDKEAGMAVIRQIVSAAREQFQKSQISRQE